MTPEDLTCALSALPGIVGEVFADHRAAEVFSLFAGGALNTEGLTLMADGDGAMTPTFLGIHARVEDKWLVHDSFLSFWSQVQQSLITSQ